MNTDREAHGGRVPLRGFGPPRPAGQPGPSGPAGQPGESGSAADPGPAVEPGHAGAASPGRADGIRHVRRLSNWTAAALIVGTGAATVALAHQALPAATAVPSPASAAGAGAGASSTAGGPSVGHTVATTSASGVTTTTTTRTVNGQAVVTHTRHAPAYHDN
jgi:hypothetical protein